MNIDYPAAVTAAYDRLETTIQAYLDQIHKISDRIHYNHTHLKTIFLGLCSAKLLTLTRASHHTIEEEQVATISQIQGAHQIVLLLGVKIEHIKHEVHPLCDDLELLPDLKLPAYST